MTQQLTHVLGVARANLQKIAIVAGDVMKLEHLRALCERVRNAVIARRLMATDRHKGEHRLVHGMRIDQSGVPANHTPSLELPYPFQDGGGSQTDNTCYICLRNAGVFLKKLQNCGIILVDHSAIMP